MADDKHDELNPALVDAAVYSNCYKSIVPAAVSTGFRTGGLRHQSLGHGNDPRVAEEFLINSRLRRHDRESESSVVSYFTDQGVAMLSLLGREETDGCPELTLPPSVDLSMELGEAIRRRRSHRHFTGDPMPLAHLGTVLRCAAGVSAMTSVDLVAGGQANLRFRTVASGGGLYPVDLYALCTGVRDLERGLYKYISTRDRIIRVADHEIVPKVLGCFAVPDDVIALSRATVVFLLVGRPWRSMRKYGARGMRFLFMEAGAISQNIHLATQALGFGSVDCASVYDDELHDVLAMDGTFQSLLHTVVVGYQGE